LLQVDFCFSLPLFIDGGDMPRRVSKRLSGMALEKVSSCRSEPDRTNDVDVPMQLVRAKVLKRKSRGAWVRLSNGSEELINTSYWGVLAALRAGADPIPPVGAWLDVMIHGLCTWKRNRDGRLRIDVHHWQKDLSYCKHESGYRSNYDAGNGLFAVPPWEIEKENR